MKKRTLRRRALLVTGLAAATLALSTTGATAATAPAAADRPAEFYEKRALELQAYVAEVFPEVVPEAEAVDVTLPADDLGDYWDDMGYLAHWVFFEDAIGQTGIALQYDEPGHFGMTPEEICADEQLSCEIEEQPDGTTLVTTVDEVAEKHHILTIRHFRADGSVTWGSGYTYDPHFDGDEGPIRDDFSVTDEQLTELVTDLELTL
jgi:hypothetical protein